jgi:hypothetical protein
MSDVPLKDNNTSFNFTLKLIKVITFLVINTILAIAISKEWIFP